MAVTKRRAWCPYVEKKTNKSNTDSDQCEHGYKAVSGTRSSTKSRPKRRKSPGDYFFKQFPKGCPNCGAAKKWMTFPEIRIPRSLRKAAAISSGEYPKGKPVEGRIGESALESVAKIVTLHMVDVKRFAECASCHEAWVWQEDTKTWVSAGEVATRHTRNKPGRTAREHFTSTGTETNAP